MCTVSSIDFEHLEKYVSGDDALRDEVLTIFQKQAENLIGLLDPHQSDDIWRDAAHMLKGASRGIGAWRVGDLCEQAETLVGPEMRDPAARAALLKDLRENLAVIIEEAICVRGRRH